ncbi:MAG: PKD domain-containing protein [Cyclobacteriaceae bacterium]|nr:PKD domain-containing protein [Cyclobacteriaceae bacterium]
MIGKGLLFTVFLAFISNQVFAQADPRIQFIENKNQWPSGIEYGARVSGGRMFLSSKGFSYYFLDQRKLEELHDRSHNPKGESSSSPDDQVINGQKIEVSFLGSNPNPVIKPFQPLSTYYNYFVGSDRSSWASKAKAYEGVYYSSFYDSIDLKIYSSGDFVKYDFIVAPGADPSEIKLKYEGVDELSMINQEVHVKTEYVSINEQKPEAFQFIDGIKVSVKCEYDLLDGIITFRFPEGYDSSKELVIDPILIFSTYSGSRADNWGSTATPGEHGNLYSSGVTNEFPNTSDAGLFPVTPGAFQTTYGGIYDVSILKYDSIGQHLLYASFLGGSLSESSHSLVVNKNNELIILGTTSSSNFPTSITGFDQTFNGGTVETNVVTYNQGSDIFVTKISADGSQLLASTFIGGSANDGMNPSNGILTANYGDQLRGDVITDDLGNIYISSVTASSNFPVVNGFDLTFNNGVTDAIVLKLNPDLSQIMWGTFVGGSGADASHTIKLDASNNVYVGGGTSSINFPVTAGVYQGTYLGAGDGWIAKIADDGSSILASTFTGTNAFNQVYFLDLNSSGDIYVYGQTAGSFTVTAGVYFNANGGQFIQKFSNDLKTLKFSTVFGSGRGIPDISPTAFLVNECNNIYVSGWGGVLNSALGFWPGSSTFGMPLTPDAYQRTTSGSDFYFMVLTDDASQLLYATYLGGNVSKTHVDGGTSRFDKSGVVYHAVCSGCAAFVGGPSSDFPTTPGAWSRTNRSTNCNNAAFKFDLSSLKARIQTNNIKLNSPGISRVCLGDKIVFQNRSIGGERFIWNLGDGPNIIKTDTSAITHQYTATGPYTVKLKAIDTGTCIGSDSTSTVITVIPPLGRGGPDQIACKDAPVQLTASGGVMYQWLDKDRKFISNQATPTVTPLDTTRYFVDVTDINGCVVKDTVNIKVVPGIDLKFEVSKVYDCLTRAKAKLINLSDEEEETYLDFGDGNTSEQKQAIHSFDKDGIYNVRVVGKKEFCTYYEEVQFPSLTLFVPNVITPGSSPGLNDTFKIKFGDQLISQTGKNVSFTVYDRWGGLVYENPNYRDNWGAENLSAGTYYYEVVIEGEATCKNWVQIIK